MADRFTYCYEIGGTLSRRTKETLIQQILQLGLATECGYFEDVSSLAKHIQEVNGVECLVLWGQDIAPYTLDKFDRFLMRHQLAFNKRCQGLIGYNGQIQWWSPDMTSIRTWEETDHEATKVWMGIEKLREAQRNGRTLDDVITALQEVAPHPGPIQMV